MLSGHFVLLYDNWKYNWNVVEDKNAIFSLWCRKRSTLKINIFLSSNSWRFKLKWNYLQKSFCFLPWFRSRQICLSPSVSAWGSRFRILWRSPANLLASDFRRSICQEDFESLTVPNQLRRLQRKEIVERTFFLLSAFQLNVDIK